jgi:hypothetical protein
MAALPSEEVFGKGLVPAREEESENPESTVCEF